ncbi:hypothetical protein L7F22_018184 [Adiantum nelumboides]|nr:hypothetical protein [Adiantum nelumboides]
MMYGSYNDGMAHDHMQRRQQGLGVPAPDHAAFDADGRRSRRPVHRRTVDHTSTAIRYIQARMWQRDWRDSTVLQPTPASSIDVRLALYLFYSWSINYKDQEGLMLLLVKQKMHRDSAA